METFTENRCIEIINLPKLSKPRTYNTSKNDVFKKAIVSDNWQTLVKANFEIALQLASNLDFLFEKNDNSERRLLREIISKGQHLRRQDYRDSPELTFCTHRQQGRGVATAFPSSSVVERAAVNRLAVGSNPTSGAIFCHLSSGKASNSF